MKKISKTIFTIIGSLLIGFGVLLGFYTGAWVMFCGGILGIANALDAHILSFNLIAWNIIKIAFATPIGVIVGLIPTIIGSFILVLGED